MILTWTVVYFLFPASSKSSSLSRWEVFLSKYSFPLFFTKNASLRRDMFCILYLLSSLVRNSNLSRFYTQIQIYHVFIHNWLDYTTKNCVKWQQLLLIVSICDEVKISGRPTLCDSPNWIVLQRKLYFPSNLFRLYACSWAYCIQQLLLTLQRTSNLCII